MALRLSLVLFFQVSCIFIYYVRAQYPTMYDMQSLPGTQYMPQMYSYPTQLQESAPYYAPSHHSHDKKHNHKKKSKHKSKRKKMRADHEVSNSQEEEYDAESKSSEGCNLNSCQQCTSLSECQPFCDTCLTNQMPSNQEILLVPYPYPFVLNMQPQSSETKLIDEDNNDTNTKTTDSSTENKTTKPTENPSERTTDKLIEKTTEKPSAKTTEKPSEKTTEKPSEKTTEQSSEKTTEKLTTKSTENPTEKTTYTTEKIITDKPPKSKRKFNKNHIRTEVLLDDISSDSMNQNSRQNNFNWIMSKNGKDKYILQSPHVLETKSPVQIIFDAEKEHAQGKDLNNIIFKLPGQDSNYVLSSSRRLREGWVPKYGIVPIPDKMASNLMSHWPNRNPRLTYRDRILEPNMALKNHRRALSQTLSDAEDNLAQADLPFELVNNIYKI